MNNQQASQTVSHSINGHNFESTYTIRPITGYQGETFVTVEASHKDTDLGVVIANTTICTKSNPDAAVREYRAAIANKLWGKL